MLHLFSPAKINLFLQIISKRQDGYHELSSICQTISLGDYLTISLSQQEDLTCTDPHLPLDSTNLILRATQLFRAKTGLTNHFSVHLVKNIPVQAGLGGGSSNAATVLWACNQLLKTNIPIHELQRWGSELGSDVPFFLSEGSAHCGGRGEQVQSLPNLPACQLWIVKPQIGLSTPAVYRQLRIENKSASNYIDASSFLAGQSEYINDLEKPAFEICPSLQTLKHQLICNGFKTVVMCGSGSAFFCLGSGSLPNSPTLATYAVHFINREPGQWFSSNEITKMGVNNYVNK